MTAANGKRLEIGVVMPFSHRTAPDYVAAAARFVEDAGFASIWVPEHVLFFADYESRYPYSDDGRVPGEPDGLLDPFTALTFVAAQTNRVRLGTGICLVPQRQPVYTAKMVADVDYLSGGRMEFGVGIGWLKEEFDNLQMDFRTRARRTIEYLEVMKALWTQDVASYSGETVTLDGCYFNPKPVQKPYPPVLFGGESDPALERVAAHGDGWFGFDLDPDAAREALMRLDAALERHGRSRNDIRCYVGPNRVRLTPETVSGYESLGIDQIIVGLFATNLDDLRRRAERILALTSS